MPAIRDGIVSAVIVDKHKLYGFSAGRTHKFVLVTFKTMAAMNRAKNLWYFKNKYTGARQLGQYTINGYRTNLYESGIPPLLRYFHIHNISPSGWIHLNLLKSRALTEDQKTTTCTYEYVCSQNAITAELEKETPVPLKICSFDIEASSSHGDFPEPVKSYRKLAIHIIDAFMRQFSVETKPMTKDRATVMMRKMIRAAFSHGTFEGIDLVYPISPPQKKEVDYLLEILVQEEMENIKVMEGADVRAATIADMFLQKNMGEETEQTESNHLDEVILDEVILDEDDEDEEIPVGKEEKGKTKEKEKEKEKEKTKEKTKEKKETKEKKTIIDFLLSEKEENDRQTKIETLTQTLGKIFPKLEGDKTTFIGSTFLRYGEKVPYRNHCVVLGTCDEIPGIDIECVDDEADLLVAWKNLIQEENPDVIIGYNIFGFDYEFLFRRSQETGCEEEFSELSRKMGEYCLKKKVDKETGDTENDLENTKVVLASGEYDLRYYPMTGRLQIDMYTYFRRDYNLSSYKLDDVAAEFISDDIAYIKELVDESESKPYTCIYSQNLAGLNAGDYIHIIINGFSSDYYADGRKFPVLEIRKDVVDESIHKDKKYNVIVIAGNHSGLGKEEYKKKLKWCMAKDDVTPQDIFRLSKGTAADRAVVAKYCIQDCNLVHHLMNKIDVITGYNEMSRICSVPISFLVFRGQGIKLTSYVAKKCREKNTLMPDLDKGSGDGGYEGAIVLPPKCNMYMDNPVACVDYSSLYPSSMISQNYSHDSKVWAREYDLDGKLIKEMGEMDASGNFIYDKLPGYEYIVIEFDTYDYRRPVGKPQAAAVKTKVGKMVCCWAQLPHNQKSIMPSILEELLKARSDTRKKGKAVEKTDPFMANILDKRQLGYKVTANSLYGQCGARTSTFYEKDVAACTTATGRMMITYAKRIIEEVYGDRVYETACQGPVKCKAEYVYGDSVADYTPIKVRQNKGPVIICAIEEVAKLFGNNAWTVCKEEGKQTKEYCELADLETWTEHGWTPLYRVIRHMLVAHKKMFRIKTVNSLVDVTDDHSLLNPEGHEISPKDCSVGTLLLDCPLPTEYIQSIECSDECRDEVTKIYSVDHVYLAKLAAIHPIYKISEFGIEQDILVLEKSDLVQPMPALKSDLVQPMPALKSDLVQPMPALKSDLVQPLNRIEYIREIPYQGYVYDLTTENHHFAAGIGNLIVHNTDSVFFTFNLEKPDTGEKIRGRPALEATIEIAQDAANLCTQFLKPPMSLAYEKTLMPFILLSKKRYVGTLYEEDPNKGKLKYMGLVLKRRDNCDLVKDVYGGVLDILMGNHSTDQASNQASNQSQSNIKLSMDFLQACLNELINGNISMEKLTITKALRSYYKNPQQIAHAVLAERIGKRDPGNKPKPGDRIKYAHVAMNHTNQTKKLLQGDKIETPEYISENQLTLDYTHYITNQLMKPLQQLFGLALEQIWESQGKINPILQFRKDMTLLEKETQNLEEFMKKKEKYCSAKVKTLLFDKFLTKIYQKENGIQTMDRFLVSQK
jgi:DNA polymerase elongation subunit (family B)